MVKALVAATAGLTLVLTAELSGQDAIAELKSGEDIFQAACVACHGRDGKGAQRSSVGFTTHLPNFTDCAFATKEPDVDWSAIIHNGGPARSFSRIMPSFREALTDEQIDQVVEHVRKFCTSPAWPRGDLNLPRAMVTEKAFPENETVITTSFNVRGAPGVGNDIVFERRFGAANQFEATVPYGFVHDTGAWRSALGDIALGYKRLLFHSLRTGSILSVSGEVTTPTGDTARGTGNGTTIFETFASYGQILPADSFVQFQGGYEQPVHTDKAPKAAYARTALGRSFSQGGGLGRTWTPMVEFISDWDLVSGAKTNWDVLPQLQIPLSRRMHIMADVGVRVPVNNTADRPVQLMFYLMWDFADGSLRQGW
ncbi:MAG TPA: cytochrome c [Bryobacteraceae bacterium]|nr:cytochrome c [Bryobacteraceae bacterium]